MRKTKIALVDDHNLFRRGLADIINKNSLNFEVVIEAENGTLLVSTFQNTEIDQLPNIIITDINMPYMDGFETVHWLKINFPNTRIIVLTMNSNESSIIRMIRLGASAYLLKNIDATDLLDAISVVDKNGFCYRGNITESYVNSLMLDHHQIESFSNYPIRNIWNSFTWKEQEFIRLSCSELNYKEISKKLNCCYSMLNSLKENVFHKLNVKTRIGLVIIAIKNNLVNQYEN